MTPDIALVLSNLAVAIVFLITEWIPLEVTALLAACSLRIIEEVF